MNKTIKKIEDKLKKLYQIYEMYIWKENNRNLIVIMNDNSIAFYLYNKNEVIDEFILSFSEKETKLYQYLCLKTLVIIFGNVWIKNNENSYYSNSYKDYVKLIVNDEVVNNMIKELIENQEKEYIDDNSLINDISKQVNGKIYKKSFINEIDKRIEITKKVLGA